MTVTIKDQSVEICNSLYWELNKSKLTSPQINKLVKDVLNILCQGGSFTIGLVNNELYKRGWKGNIINQNSMELLCNLLKFEFNFSITEHTVQ